MSIQNYSPLHKRLLRVLLIEDTKERQEILINLYRAHAWILVNTARRAITLISAYDFDIITLDYNLLGQLTGKDVAHAIRSSHNENARIVIHSMNLKGAEELSRILPDAVQYPVYKMIRSNKVFKHLREQIDLLGSSFNWEL